MIDAMVLKKPKGRKCELWFMDNDAECGVVFDYVDRGGAAQEVIADFLCEAIRKPEFTEHWLGHMSESDVPDLKSVVARMVEESEEEMEGEWVARIFNCRRKEA